MASGTISPIGDPPGTNIINIQQLIGDTFVARELGGAYKGKFQQFKRWVDRTPGVSPNDGKYITSRNVDIFFLTYLSKRSDIQPQNLQQYRNALKQEARNVEYPPPGSPPLIDSAAVLQAIELQRMAYTNKRLDKPESAHANLNANVLSHDNKKDLMLAAMLFPSWTDLCSSLASMTQTAFRGNSIRKCRMCDLWVDSVHGPQSYPMLGILQQDHVGKVKTPKKKLRGMWRHKEWSLCGT